MIRKIKHDEYLKEYGAMSEGERKDYWARVGEWLAEGGKKLLEATDRPMAKAQNIVQLSMKWKEPEVRMFADGVRLLSALVNVADTWLPSQLYARSAYRAVRQMVMTMQTHPLPLPVMEGSGHSKNSGGLIITEEQKRRIVEKYTKKALQRPEQKAGAETAKPSGKPTGTRTAQTAVTAPIHHREGQGVGPVPVRPRHIDQYVHLLPQKTQERAAKYGPLMREMGEARENLRLLVDDPGASSASRESWAKKITKIDGEVKAIREELDREWAKLVEQGRVVVDELGNARVVSSALPEGEGAPDGKPSGTVAGGAGAVDDGGEADNQRKAALLRKWLIDTRYGNGDDKKREKYQEKWREKYREMVRLGGSETVTEKVRAAAKHYGIDLDTLNANGHDVF